MGKGCNQYYRWWFNSQQQWKCGTEMCIVLKKKKISGPSHHTLLPKGLFAYDMKLCKMQDYNKLQFRVISSLKLP